MLTSVLKDGNLLLVLFFYAVHHAFKNNTSNALNHIQYLNDSSDSDLG